MQRHWRFLIVLFALVLFGFVTGAATGSIAISLGSIVCGIVVAFVMGIAFLRPEGHTPEHHPPVDRALDDTNP